VCVSTLADVTPQRTAGGLKRSDRSKVKVAGQGREVAEQTKCETHYRVRPKMRFFALNLLTCLSRSCPQLCCLMPFV